MSLGYGTMSVYSFAYTLGGALATVFSLGEADIKDISSTGAISLEYMRWVSPHVGVGALGVYELCPMTFEDNTSSRSHLISVMPAAKFAWLGKDHFGMYTKIAAGVGAAFDDGSADFSFAAQVNPVGMDFGGQSFRGFLELGWGMQGLVMFGLRKSF